MERARYVKLNQQQQSKMSDYTMAHGHLDDQGFWCWDDGYDDTTLRDAIVPGFEVKTVKRWRDNARGPIRNRFTKGLTGGNSLLEARVARLELAYLALCEKLGEEPIEEVQSAQEEAKRLHQQTTTPMLEVLKQRLTSSTALTRTEVRAILAEEGFNSESVGPALSSLDRSGLIVKGVRDGHMTYSLRK
jgi:cytochrome P450